MQRRITTVAGAMLAIATFASLAAAPASAGPGEWDYKGSDIFTNQSHIFFASGGNFLFCLEKGSKHGAYKVWEQDDWGADDSVDVFGYTNDFWYPSQDGLYSTNHCIGLGNINKYLDDDNGNHQAEFYLTKSSGGNSTVKAYD